MWIYLMGDLAELAYTERKWEFAGEYMRWNDLLRMERVQEALSNRNPQVSIGTSLMRMVIHHQNH